jgi:hypothetical protein
MAACAACGGTILFGGKRDGEHRYCNEECFQRGILLTIASQVPSDVVRQHMRHLHRGPCPQCQGAGPVDVHLGYRVWSAILVTSWRSNPRVGCRSCGLKGQVRDVLFCLVLGWWGIPWGFIMTPIQTIRNVVAMLKPPDPFTPSEQLEKVVRTSLALQVVAAQAGPVQNP